MIRFDELMSAAGEELGLPDFRPNSDGGCALEVDGLRVSFMESVERGEVLTWAEVCDLPENGREPLLRALMTSAFLGTATDGASVAIDAETGRICLQRFDALASLDGPSFLARLEKFVQTLVEWRRIAGEFRPLAEEVAQKAEDGMSFRELHNGNVLWG